MTIQFVFGGTIIIKDNVVFTKLVVFTKIKEDIIVIRCTL